MTSDESPLDVAASSYRVCLDPVASASFEHEAPAAGSPSGRATGTLLEAAFVDPAYPWPPEEGRGPRAVELRPSLALPRSADEGGADSGGAEEGDEEVSLSPSMVSSDEEEPEDGFQEERPKFRTKKINASETVVSTKGRLWWKRVITEEVVSEKEVRIDEQGNVITDLEATQRQRDFNERRRAAELDRVQRRRAKEARRAECRRRVAAKRRQRRREARATERHRHVPAGVLIYRLDTSSRAMTLVSGPHRKTDAENLLQRTTVGHAAPDGDVSPRRGILITDAKTGMKRTLVACEQRTAVAWLEVIDMMLAGASSSSMRPSASGWATGAESELSQQKREEIEERYVNLAAYSNNLIRAGAIPGAGASSSDSTKTSSQATTAAAGGAGGIYYAVERFREDGDEYDEETLESIARRRAVIKDSWDFFRMVCSLLRDRRKYDEVFRRMQTDPVYPYLNAMAGLNDPGDDMDKPLAQPHREEYGGMGGPAIAQHLVLRAEAALPSLVQICKGLAESLGLEEVGVGPVKDAGGALRKARKKYAGDVLKVTDYCRGLLVVKDFPTLLALLEIARASFGPLIRRVRLGTLKADRAAKPGGYRDCVINLELKEHICEIQIHLWPMWVIIGVDGFRHYQHCLEYSADTFRDPVEALAGLDRETMAGLVVMAEEAVADMPLESLEWYQEKFIMDYSAEVGLLLKHGLHEWAETTLNALIRLRCQSPDIGPDHHETITLYRYLEQALRAQKKTDEAGQVEAKILRHEHEKRTEKAVAKRLLLDQWGAESSESKVDPNNKEKKKEEKKKRVRASKRAWRKIREEKFKFLEGSE